MTDLWPEGIGPDEATLPVTPLLEQAELLGNHTQNLVKAEVVPKESSTEMFAYDFDLVVQVLSYRFTLFSLQYSITAYPAYVIPFTQIAAELEFSRFYLEERYITGVVVNDEQQLLRELARILNSKTTRNILRTLVSQARTFKR